MGKTNTTFVSKFFLHWQNRRKLKKKRKGKKVEREDSKEIKKKPGYLASGFHEKGLEKIQKGEKMR